MTGILRFNLTLILQSHCVEHLNFPIIGQRSLTLTSRSTYSLSQIQHLVEFSKSASSVLVITSSLFTLLLPVPRWAGDITDLH